MTTYDQTLSKSLLYLPLDLLEKVFIWLTYRDLKPVSEVSLTRRGRKTKERDIKRVKNWLHRANLYYSYEKGSRNSLHIGKNKENVRLSSKILHSIVYDKEIKTGILMGYPKSSVKAYAKNGNIKLGQNPIPLIYPGFFLVYEKTKNLDYLPYLVYAISTQSFDTDLQTAKKWAKLIRKEVPILAKWYEEYFYRKNKIGTKNKAKLQKKLELSQLPISILFSRYSSVNEPKQKLINILSDFNNDYIDEFQVASMANILLKQLSIVNKSDLEFTNILKKCIQMSQPGKKINLKKIISNSIEIQKWYNKKISPQG